MSGWKKHLIIGLITQILILIIIEIIGVLLLDKWLLGIKEVIILTPLLFINPLLPDIDHPSSKITKALLIISLIGLTAGFVKAIFFGNNTINNFLILSYALLAITIIISNFVKHRGFTHKTITSIIYATIIGVATMNPYIGLITLGGYQSHLILDNKKED